VEAAELAMIAARELLSGCWVYSRFCVAALRAGLVCRSPFCRL